MLSKIYQKVLKSHFFIVQSAQTAFMMGLGDFLSQKVVEKRPWRDYYTRRTLEFCFMGGCVVGPAVSVWYTYLNKTFGHEKISSTALKKTAADQLIFAPGFLIVFLTILGLIHGDNMEEIRKNIDRQYFDIVITNWKVWPAVQLINFYFMPLKYQVLLVQSVAVFWNTYLSWKTQNDFYVKKTKKDI